MSVKYGDKGSFVASLQRELLAKGYQLPMFGADGDFGKETLQAVYFYSLCLLFSSFDVKKQSEQTLERTSSGYLLIQTSS